MTSTTASATTPSTTTPSTATPKSTTTTPTTNAITFCSNICFHRSIYLPATSAHPKSRVTFATSTNFEDAELPAILFCHPMGAARYLMFGFEEVAKRCGVRVLIIDRPGFGGSTPVSVDQRVSTWLESVIAVLGYLNVKHVAVVSHSAGTIYAINTAVKLSHLLHPRRPFVACFAPWVHPKHSSASLMQVVDKLPSSWVGNLHHIQGFVAGYIAPSISFSAAKLGVGEALDEDTCFKTFGIDAQTRREVEKLQGKWQRFEDTSAISADATLCMQQDAKNWGAYSSLPKAVDALKGGYGVDPSTSASSTHHLRKLTFHVYFSSSDVMIGKGGQQYFENCWRQGNVQQEIEFVAKTVPDTDHDSIVLAEKGCIEKVFGEVGKRME